MFPMLDKVVRAKRLLDEAHRSVAAATGKLQAPTLTERQHEVLASMFLTWQGHLQSMMGTTRWQRAMDASWVTPMEIGARDQSHHSKTLQQLVAKRLVETKKSHSIHCMNGSTSRKKLVDNRWHYTDGHPPYDGCSCKGSRRYRITEAGIVAFKQPGDRDAHRDSSRPDGARTGAKNARGVGRRPVSKLFRSKPGKRRRSRARVAGR